MELNQYFIRVEFQIRAGSTYDKASRQKKDFKLECHARLSSQPLPPPFVVSSYNYARFAVTDFSEQAHGPLIELSKVTGQQ